MSNFLKIHVPLLRVAKKVINILPSSGDLLFININLLEELHGDNATALISFKNTSKQPKK